MKKRGNQTPSVNTGGPAEKPHQRTLRRVRGDALGHSLTLQEHIGWHHNAVLTGLSFYVRDGVWNSVIKADFGNRPMVAFVNVGTFARCLETTAYLASKGYLTWQPDKKPPRTRAKQRPLPFNRSH